MKKAKVIQKSVLAPMYPLGIIPMFDDSLSHSRYQSVNLSTLPDQLVVNTNTGAMVREGLPFTMLRLIGHGSSYKYLLSPNTKLETVEIEEFVDKIKPVLEELMPGRYFIAPYGKDEYFLYLYYPYIKMTNNIGGQHEIHDMIVQIYIHEDIARSGMYGMRMSFTKEEIANRYVHSHLPAGGYTAFESFCLGSTALAKLFERGVTDLDTFAMLLFQIESYLAWESLEGKPYISFESVSNNIGTNMGPALTPRDYPMLDDLARRFVKEMTPDLLTPTTGGGIGYILAAANKSQEIFDLERKITQESPYKNALHDYDVNRKTYVKSASSGGDIKLPDYNTYYKFLIDAFKITPRIIESKAVEGDHIIKRLALDQLTHMFGLVNSYLGQGHIIDETNRITTKSESNNIKDTSVSSDVFAF